MYRIDMGTTWPETDLVFTTRTGRPVEPRNLVRSFWRICDTNKVRTIKVHHLRHTVGSLLKDLKVPARDAQTILGHPDQHHAEDSHRYRRTSPPRRADPTAEDHPIQVMSKIRMISDASSAWKLSRP